MKQAQRAQSRPEGRQPRSLAPRLLCCYYIFPFHVLHCKIYYCVTNKNGITDACSTVDCCPLMSIVVHCSPLLPIVVHITPHITPHITLNVTPISPPYHPHITPHIIPHIPPYHPRCHPHIPSISPLMSSPYHPLQHPLTVSYVISSKHLLFKNIAHDGSFQHCTWLYLALSDCTLALPGSAKVCHDQPTYLPMIYLSYDL